MAGEKQSDARARPSIDRASIIQPQLIQKYALHLYFSVFGVYDFRSDAVD
jgi:hypothetical protein